MTDRLRRSDKSKRQTAANGRLFGLGRKKVAGTQASSISRNHADNESSSLAPRYGVRRQTSSKDVHAQREPGFLRRTVNAWCNRLFRAVLGGHYAQETEQYLAHQTSRDYVMNTLGQSAWGALFPLLTMVCSWLVGTEKAGVFSMAFTIGTVLMYVANYGVRTYQVSDLDDMRSFLDYQISRLITCAAALLCGWVWCLIRGYDALMFMTCMGIITYRAIDGLADVFEGRLQQKDKLYLAGLSLGVRSVVGFVCFVVALFITRNTGIAACAMALGGIATVILLSAPLAHFETDKSLPLSVRGLKEVFVECLPLFLSAFLYNVILSMPKFVMEGTLTYDNQLYYNAMFFSSQMIIMTCGFIYNPQLVRLSKIWDDPEGHHRFDLVIIAMLAVIAAISAVMAVFMGWIGIPLMGIMYDTDFTQFTSLMYVMVAAGGACACVDFLSQIVTVMRAQNQISKLYIVAAAFSVPVVILLVNFSDLAGAVVGGLVSISILLVLLVMEYLAIRARLARR